MKCAVQLLKLAFIIMLCSGLMITCRKNDSTPDDPSNSPDPTVNKDSIDADTISNYLQFFNATKIQGTIPKGPAASTLKMSIKDTLYLNDEIKWTLKFFHEDSTQNVAGIYLQIHGFLIGSVASYYYKVPELPDMANSDTVSVIMVGVDPSILLKADAVTPGNIPSLVFNATITPYNKNGDILGEATRPVKISDPKIDPAGQCGLILPAGDYWDWDYTYVLNEAKDGLSFYNSPDFVHGAEGQIILGCCSNGVSSYNTVFNCHLDPAKSRSKHFATFLRMAEATTKFVEGGAFAHFSKTNYANPVPDESDFCTSAAGVVDETINGVFDEGNWSIQQVAPVVYNDSLVLSLQTTNSTGIGFGQPRGIIHYLTCDRLLLIIPDPEFPDNLTYSFYKHVNTNIIRWYEM